MTTPHPRYANPTIAEALCEIHFRLKQGQDWKESFAHELFDKIKAEYPSMEPIKEMAVQIDINPSTVGHKVLPSRTRMRFKHVSRPIMLQLVEGVRVLTVNMLPPYPGWDSMAETILRAWENNRAALAPVAISRIGLRYINQVKRGGGDVVGDWIRPNDFIPTIVLQSERGFFSRVQAQLGGQNRIMVTLGEQGNSLVLDIDRIREEECEIVADKVRGTLDELHHDVWRAFASCQGKKFQAWLSREVTNADQRAS
jgi:uncharacterized protein (TIGR04255 family)